MEEAVQVATIGGGCFWCLEAVFQQLEGVEDVVSGYAGGTVPGTPTYREVCSGLTGHAEVIQIAFNPEVISYSDILAVFFASHDPTTLNRQGADLGSQYRSVIYYHNTDQKQIALAVKEKMQVYFERPVVTEITALPVFFPAESYHQNYYSNNKTQGYCRMVIAPKVAKIKKLYASKIKHVKKIEDL